MTAINNDRLPNGAENARGNFAGFTRVPDVIHHDREFIAADSRHSIAWPQPRLHPPGNLAEQQIANPVTESVVDLLEAVQIDKQHGDLLAEDLSLAQRSIQMLFV